MGDLDLFSWVHRAWDFLPVPVGALVSAVFVARLIAGPWATAIGKRCIGSVSGVASNRETRRALRFLGLSKLAPLVALVAILLALHAVRESVVVVGNAFPGRLVTIQPNQLLSQAEPEFLQRLWSAYPAAQGPHELSLVLNEEVQQAMELGTLTSTGGVKAWSDSLHQAYSWLSLAKWLATWSLVVVLASRGQRSRNWGMRWVCVLMVLLLFGIGQMHRIKYCEEQRYYSKISAMKLLLRDHHATALSGDQQRELANAGFSGGSETWWRFDMSPRLELWGD